VNQTGVRALVERHALELVDCNSELLTSQDGDGGQACDLAILTSWIIEWSVLLRIAKSQA
jgi:hypothetical protein